jgi:hypothetical protein
VCDSAIKLLPLKSNDVCLAIFQEIHNDPSDIRKVNVIDTSDVGKEILQHDLDSVDRK